MELHTVIWQGIKFGWTYNNPPIVPSCIKKNTVIPYWTPKFRSRLFAIAILGPCNSHILIPHRYFWLYIWYNINYIPVVKSSSIIMQCYTPSVHPCQLFMSFSVGTNTDLPLLTVVLWSVCTKCWKITAGFVFTNKHESEWGCPAQWQELLLKFTFFLFHIFMQSQS